MDSFYKRYESLKKSKGLTDSDVSRATGISTARFSGWKNGKFNPSASAVATIAKYFGVSASWLMTGEEEQIETPIEIIELADLIGEFRRNKRLQEYCRKFASLNERDMSAVEALIDAFEQKSPTE